MKNGGAPGRGGGEEDLAAAERALEELLADPDGEAALDLLEEAVRRLEEAGGSLEEER
ncbi:MAG: hypothetical protein QME88_00445 [Actinomycetota bacterium]|nr:hypothetical protein [Actinomycetota bacterium]